MSDPFDSPHLPPSAPSSPDARPSGGTAVLEREDLSVSEPGDHERFAHYVRSDRIAAAMIEGKPVIALCGKVWVPSRDPSKIPVCPTCKEIYDTHLNPGGDE